MPPTLLGPMLRPSAFCPHWYVDEPGIQELASDLLDYSRKNQARFERSRIGSGGDVKVDPKRRVSSVCPLDGSLHDKVSDHILQILPNALEALGMYPFTTGKVETELAVHGDGAFFVRHTDVRRDILGAGSSRHVTAVLYFHTMPRRFEGGTLRLYPVRAEGLRNEGAHSQDAPEMGWQDFEPRHGSILFFPSGLQHEVLPVRAPDVPFEHQRFALNIWVHKI